MTFNQHLVPGEHCACIMFTDLEPDDQLMLWLMRTRLRTFTKLLVVVGESQENKVVLGRNILKSIGIDNAQVVRGDLSTKYFPAAMLDAYGPYYEVASDTPTTDVISELLACYPKSLIIVAKPPRELLRIKEDLLKRAKWVLYGSFNFRALGPDLPKIEHLINDVFAASVVYESFLATGATNSVTHTNTMLFKHMKERAAAGVLFWKGLQASIEAWNGSVAVDCLETVSKLSLEMIDDFAAGNWEELRKKKRRIEERNWKIVANIVDAESQQMVFADCAMASVLCCADAIHGVKGKISFADTGYTVPVPDDAGRVFFVTQENPGTDIDFERSLRRMTELAMTERMAK